MIKLSKRQVTRFINKLTNRPSVAVVKLKGVIGKVGFNQGISLDGVQHLDRIKKINNLKAIALVINSPGGSPVQSELIAKKIALLAENGKRKKRKKFLLFASVKMLLLAVVIGWLVLEMKSIHQEHLLLVLGLYPKDLVLMMQLKN